MFRGDYNFFDYKYNIANYTGQDYGSIAQNIYLIGSICLLILLLFLFRKSSKERVNKIVKILSVFLIVFYISKTTWESIYDIKLQGSFNTGLLPFDACSIIMLAGILSGFTKGKLREYADSWIATGGIVGGISALLFLNALKYYPFFSFGALYSMIWHFLMLFIGLLFIVTNYVEISYKTLINGFIFHLIISFFVILIDFIFDFDFMMYRYLGSIPIFENVASIFSNNGLQILNPILMIILYFFSFNVVFFIPLLVKKIRTVKKT